jgi:hypothetical protein
MDREATDLICYQFNLARMNPGSNSDTQPRDACANSMRASHRSGGTIEDRKKAVACGLNLAAPKAIELEARLLIVLLEQVAPCVIADALHVRGRVDYVRAQNRCQHAIAVGGRGVDLRARELYRLEGFVADNDTIMAGRDVIDIIDPEFLYLTRIGFNSHAASEDDADVMDLAPTRIRNRSDIARPSPSRLHDKPADDCLVVRYGFDPAMWKVPNLLGALEALSLKAWHVIPATISLALGHRNGTPDCRRC